MECALALDNHWAMAERINPDRKEVAYRIRLLRRSFGYESQTEWVRFLAIDAITKAHWNNWEHGTVPTNPNLRQIDLKTGAKGDWILWGDKSVLTVRLAAQLDERERRDREEEARQAEEAKRKPAQPTKELKRRRRRN